MFTSPPTYLLTYLPIIYTMLKSTNVWYTKYEGITVNELTTILIIFKPLTLINDNLENGYYTFNQLIWFTHKYCIFWQLLLNAKIVEDSITNKIPTLKRCYFKYNTTHLLVHILWPKCKTFFLFFFPFEFFFFFFKLSFSFSFWTLFLFFFLFFF